MFNHLLATNYPVAESIPDATQDNPFPLAILTFTLLKSVFGLDEVTDAYKYPPPGVAPGDFQGAFWITIEGLSYEQIGYGTSVPQVSFQAVGSSPIINPVIQLSTSTTATPNPTFSLPAAYLQRQIVRYSYDVSFGQNDLSQFPQPGQSTNQLLSGKITVSGVTSSAQASVELTGGLNPYFTNNPLGSSPNLVTFTVTPAVQNTPIQITSPLFPQPPSLGQGISGQVTDDDAFKYIQNIISTLNSNSVYTDPSTRAIKTLSVSSQCNPPKKVEVQ